jgi:hypothetical protein
MQEKSCMPAVIIDDGGAIAPPSLFAAINASNAYSAINLIIPEELRWLQGKF